MKLGITLSLVFLLSASVFGNNPVNKKEKCGIVAHTDYLIQKDPDLGRRLIDDENRLQQKLEHASVQRNSNVVFTIPVVVHVVYKTTAQNVSNAQIQAQIDVLNQDFGRTNPDSVNTPSAFTSVASSTNFQFCLAKRDPNGNATTGIERRLTTLNSFSINDDVKSYATGGLDAWDVSKYMNIWVCNLSGGIIGYGELPTSAHSNTYGVVIAYDAFGKGGSATPPYHLGRTCTHEISHCFNLFHIWGDDNGSCSGTDYVADTPNQSDATYGCFSFPETDNCSANSPGIMYMNYMDYSDDNCLNMFTKNQATRMYVAMNSYYPTLFTSNGCDVVTGAETIAESFDVSIYPNPSQGVFTLDMFGTNNMGDEITVRVTDMIGKTIFEKVILHPDGTVHTIDLGDSRAGVYIVSLEGENYKLTRRIIVER